LNNETTSDASNGYDAVAETFRKHRESSTIGAISLHNTDCDARTDVLTGHAPRSIGAAAYKATCRSAGLEVVDEFQDEGGNHYYHVLRID
jgi:hypothetical protein